MPLPIIAAVTLPAIISTFVRFLIGTAIVRVITALGISLVTYATIDTVAGYIQSYMVSNVAGFGTWQPYVDAIGLPAAVNIVSSAYIGAVAVRALMGAFNKITFGSVGN